MPQQIFINLPVRELARAQAFFSALGWTVDPRFTNDQAACIQVSDTIYVMLLVEPFFQGFTTKPISNAHERTEVLLALSVDSREAVHALVARAVAAGATTPNPLVDHGFMLQHGFADLDGHQWEVFWMDMQQAPQQATQQAPQQATQQATQQAPQQATLQP